MFFSAADLLSSWGYEEGVEYFDDFLNNESNLKINNDPHRLHGYDEIYEKIADSCLRFESRLYDRSVDSGNKARKKYFQLLVK